MKIILQPTSKEDAVALQVLYDQAINEATELFVVSAYLTDWQPKQKITQKCRELAFVVGTDFGLTRKDACRKVLRWLPDELKSDFVAADHIGGFHPKLVMWKDERGQGHLLLGSSNLTLAAFSTNYEANALFKISDEQFNDIKKWIYKIRLECSPISEDWLEQYKEAPKTLRRPSGKKVPVVFFRLPSGDLIDKAIAKRRKQHQAFVDIKEPLASLIEKCTQGVVSNEQFYEEMMTLWGHHPSRLMGKGFEIVGKHGNWQEVCKSISTILLVAQTASGPVLDNIVRKEIDRLSMAQNPNRGAWLSEMLCHYFPDLYPLINKPVRMWLQDNKYRAPRKTSEGAKYIDLAMKLRQAIKQNTKNRAKDLLELDHAIWQWYKSKYKS